MLIMIATQMIDRLLNSQLNSQSKQSPSYPTHFPVIKDEEEEAIEEPEFGSNACLYAWNFESTDLGKLVIILRMADGVQYTIKKIDEHQIEITADGSLNADEIESLAKDLHIPLQMLKFRSQPWKQSVVIQTDNQISGGPSVAAVIGTLKVVTFPILSIKEDAILVL
jgi:hypothetical protein